MKKDLKGAMTMIVLLIVLGYALYASVSSYPEGFAEAGHCSDTGPNSEVCWCDKGEIREYINESSSFECLEDEG